MRRRSRAAVSRCRPRDAWARFLLVLLLALAPALNLAAPVALRSAGPAAGTMPEMADASPAAASEPCTHANVAAGDDGCDAADHAGAAHHADPLCLQCVAFGVPGLPGAPDIVMVVSTSVGTTAYRCHPAASMASPDFAAQGCRGPPAAV